ncbi:Cruciform DNA binding protein [Saitoella coloradoensis]
MCTVWALQKPVIFPLELSLTSNYAYDTSSTILFDASSANDWSHLRNVWEQEWAFERGWWKLVGVEGFQLSRLYCSSIDIYSSMTLPRVRSVAGSHVAPKTSSGFSTGANSAAVRAHTSAWPASEVYVTGTFDNWSRSTRLSPTPSSATQKKTSYSAEVELPSTEKILYKFVVDGQWVTSPLAATETDAEGNVNNVLYENDIVNYVRPKLSAEEPAHPVKPIEKAAVPVDITEPVIEPANPVMPKEAAPSSTTATTVAGIPIPVGGEALEKVEHYVEDLAPRVQTYLHSAFASATGFVGQAAHVVQDQLHLPGAYPETPAVERDLSDFSSPAPTSAITPATSTGVVATEGQPPVITAEDVVPMPPVHEEPVAAGWVAAEGVDAAALTAVQVKARAVDTANVATDKAAATANVAADKAVDVKDQAAETANAAAENAAATTQAAKEQAAATYNVASEKAVAAGQVVSEQANVAADKAVGVKNAAAEQASAAAQTVSEQATATYNAATEKAAAAGEVVSEQATVAAATAAGVLGAVTAQATGLLSIATEKAHDVYDAAAEKAHEVAQAVGLEAEKASAFASKEVGPEPETEAMIIQPGDKIPLQPAQPHVIQPDEVVALPPAEIEDAETALVPTASDAEKAIVPAAGAGDELPVYDEEAAVAPPAEKSEYREEIPYENVEDAGPSYVNDAPGYATAGFAAAGAAGFAAAATSSYVSKAPATAGSFNPTVPGYDLAEPIDTTGKGKAPVYTTYTSSTAPGYTAPIREEETVDMRETSEQDAAMVAEVPNTGAGLTEAKPVEHELVGEERRGSLLNPQAKSFVPGGTPPLESAAPVTVEISEPVNRMVRSPGSPTLPPVDVGEKFAAPVATEDEVLRQAAVDAAKASAANAAAGASGMGSSIPVADVLHEAPVGAGVTAHGTATSHSLREPVGGIARTVAHVGADGEVVPTEEVVRAGRVDQGIEFSKEHKAPAETVERLQGGEGYVAQASVQAGKVRAIGTAVVTAGDVKAENLAVPHEAVQHLSPSSKGSEAASARSSQSGAVTPEGRGHGKDASTATTGTTDTKGKKKGFFKKLKSVFK